MGHFTEDNTAGFNAKELATLNEAFDQLMTGIDPEDAEQHEKAAKDKLTNAWVEGITAKELVERCK